MTKRRADFKVQGFFKYLQDKYNIEEMTKDYSNYMDIIENSQSSVKHYPELEISNTIFEDILSTVSAASGVYRQDILSKSRRREVVLSRHLITYYCYRKKLGSLVWIGRKLGNKDHSTVIHAKNGIEDLLQVKDNNLRPLYEITKHLLEL